ncbi:DoxX family protein [Acuticoccus sediminis]|uniref:DoxX family protein n=1 Tax=Acuticoccus sediminis TaxID=2184697 RepID=UPI001CFD24AA|nr:DoxX family protein [Acuticoccus sediminis]
MTTDTEILAPASPFGAADPPPPRLIIPRLQGFYVRMEGVAYALLRAAFGLTIVTHGIPKMLGIPHGSMADPMAGSTNLIGNVLGLPFAPQLAMVVALLETFGGLAVALGLATRLFAPMLAVQMAAICLAIGPTYPWIDRGIEYPIMLGFVALAIAIRGGGPYSLDRRLGVEL